MLDRKGVPWESVRLRDSTRKFLTQLSRGVFDERIRYIVLFGSEARGEANLFSDVDIAVVSDEPITQTQKLSILDAVDEDVEVEVDYRLVSTRTKDLDCDHFMNVNYHIKREGLVIYEKSI